MIDLAGLQAAFQRAIVENDDTILADIRDGVHQPRNALLGLYRHAHDLRLREAVDCQQDVLRAYLGDPAFAVLAGAYIAAVPSGDPNVRRFTQGLPSFLKLDGTYAGRPVLADLAAIAVAHATAFEAADAPVLSPADLAALTAAALDVSVLRPHPSAIRLDLASNAADIRQAIEAGAPPPAEAPATGPLILWRRHTTTTMRVLDAAEALLWDMAAQGASVAGLRVWLADRHGASEASNRMRETLFRWAGDGLLAADAASEGGTPIVQIPDARPS